MYDGYKTYSETKPSKQKITGKAILLGESGVGKTCIIRRLVDDIFNMITPTTFGSSSTEKKYVFNNTELKLDIWDTAGQEKYRSLTKFFYKDAAIAILVYDITRKVSFDEILTYWSEQLIECGASNLIIGIAGNKSDLFNEEEVKEIDGKVLANRLGAVFQLTSALTNSGIDTLFQKLGAQYLTNYLQSDEAATVSSTDKDERKQLTSDNSDKDSKKKKCC